MTGSSEHKAPKLGTPTDSDVGAQAVRDVNVDGEDIPASGGDVPEAEKTMDTPDVLGGTGGEQGGGAG